MTTRDVLIPPTTAAILRSALIKAGARPRPWAGPDEIERAVRVVAPCTGLLGPVSPHWTEAHSAALLARIAAGRPTLTVASRGAFLLTTAAQPPFTDPGLAQAAGTPPATAAPAEPLDRLPGWSQIRPDAACRIIRPGWAYFETWRGLNWPEGWSIARHGENTALPAAYERGSVLACLFRPELSAQWGLQVLQLWLAAD
jgi:imidazoleglycerol phosphate synthase glutamine amidotransferase subunit HisH